MRHITSVITILVIAGLLVGSTACNQQADQVRTVFSVDGMHCDACSNSIVSTLEKVDGVDGASADHEKGRAEVTYRPRKVEADKLKAEIEKLGFTVIGMETKTVEG